MEIEKFKAAWNPETHEGRIRLYSDRDEKHMLEVSDPAEFTAMVTLLSSSEEIELKHGWLQTGAEAIDGD